MLFVVVWFFVIRHIFDGRYLAPDLRQTRGPCVLRGYFCVIWCHSQACKGLVCAPDRYARWGAINSRKHAFVMFFFLNPNDLKASNRTPNSLSLALDWHFLGQFSLRFDEILVKRLLIYNLTLHKIFVNVHLLWYMKTISNYDQLSNTSWFVLTYNHYWLSLHKYLRVLFHNVH